MQKLYRVLFIASCPSGQSEKPVGKLVFKLYELTVPFHGGAYLSGRSSGRNILRFYGNAVADRVCFKKRSRLFLSWNSRIAQKPTARDLTRKHRRAQA